MKLKFTKQASFKSKMQQAVLIVLMLLPIIGFSEEIHVPADYATIQEGIDAANDGDVVLVALGTYLENIDFSGKAIHLLSEQGPELTIIDGGMNGSCVTFDSGEDENSIIDGFTITNGSGTYNIYAEDYIGGGVYMTGNVSPVIQNNIITQNTASAGGGVGFRNGTIMGSPSLINNVINNNNDVGISITAAVSLTMIGNTVSQNTEEGIDLWYVTENLIHNNTIANNAVDGIYFRDCANLTVSENVIDNNGSCGIYQRATETSIITGNTITNNQDNGIYIWDCTVQTEISDNIISNSSADGVSFRDSELISIVNNQIDGNATGVYAWYVENLNVVNTLIYGNGSDGCSLRNVTFANIVNTTCVNNDENGFRVRDSDDVLMGNTIVRNNDGYEIYVMFSGVDPIVSYCNIEDGFAGIGNIDADPLFVDEANGDYNLISGSPSIDAGNNDAVPEGITEDLGNSPRFWDDLNTPDTGNGTAPVVDMGAYEWPIMNAITFTVTDGTDPIEGATISVSSTQITTDVNGEASMLVPDDDYAYTVIADGYDEATGTVTVSGAAVFELVVLTETEYSVTFHVYDVEGDIEGAEVTFDGVNGFFTDASGMVEIGEFPNGTYGYEVTADGFLVLTDTVEVAGAAVVVEVLLTTTTTVAELELNAIEIYPNPASSSVNIKSTLTIEQLEIVNQGGQCVKHLEVNSAVINLNIDDINSGIYFIKIVSNNTVITKKLVIE